LTWLDGHLAKVKAAKVAKRLSADPLYITGRKFFLDGQVRGFADGEEKFELEVARWREVRDRCEEEAARAVEVGA
jgi:hypothetical protein